MYIKIATRLIWLINALNNYNINFELTKKVHVKFHNLRGYESPSIFNEFDKFNVNIKVIG